jgi:hypothetical protein
VRALTPFKHIFKQNIVSACTSVMARPHMGMAGHAMERRVKGSISSTANTPWSRMHCSSSPFKLGGTFLMIT